jgi:hypothetical protein
MTDTYIIHSSFDLHKTKRFSKTYMLFKLVYFVPYLMPHIMYHTLHAKMYFFFFHGALLKLRYLSRNIVNPEQVRTQTFCVNDFLLYVNSWVCIVTWSRKTTLPSSLLWEPQISQTENLLGLCVLLNVMSLFPLQGTSTLALISGMWMLSRKLKLPPRAYTAATAVAVMGWTQVWI